MGGGNLVPSPIGSFVSPGVYTREFDFSLYISQLSTTIFGCVGLATRGPINTPTKITSRNSFNNTFGDNNTNYMAPYAVSQYLRKGQQLWFVRVGHAPGSVSNEVVGTGNGTNTTFTHTLAQYPIKPGTLTITAGTVTGTDNGFGVITGTGIASGSTVNYATGALTVTFTTAPSSGTAIDASYTGGGYAPATVILNDTTSVPLLNIQAITPGTWGNYGTVPVTNRTVGLQVIVSAGSIANSFKIQIVYKGVTVETFNNLSRGGNVSGTTDYVAAISPQNLASPPVGAVNMSNYITVTEHSGNTADLLTGTFNLSGGTDGYKGAAATDVLSDSDVTTGINLLSNSQQYDLNIIAAPGFSSAAITSALINLATNRGDTFAAIDPPKGLSPVGTPGLDVLSYVNGTCTFNGGKDPFTGGSLPSSAFNSSYGGIWWPWVQIFDDFNGVNVYAAPSGFFAESAAFTDFISDSSRAPAGFNRGQITNGLGVEYVLAQGDRDAMYSNSPAVNPIASFIGQGIVIWGQKTLQVASTALNRINVRRIMLYIKKVIATASPYLVFEPDNPVTWRAFIQLVQPYLQSLQDSGSITNFQIVCDASTNTPSVIANNEMHAIIYIQPTPTAEILVLDFVLTNQGATFPIST